jgi:branched-chain amino acid transport system substrate-binding protein
MVNRSGGVDGRTIRLRTIAVPGSDAVPQAIAALHRSGIGIVVGSHGSTISRPAAALAARDGMLFWETGAVGNMATTGRGSLVFRVAPTGQHLGRTAIDFVAHVLARRLGRAASSLRFAVTEVDDAYGRAVAAGAESELRRLRLHLAGAVPYGLLHLDPAGVVRRLARMHPDVVFASSYIRDGVAIRRQMVRQHLHLLGAIGTSSSYCMLAFGRALGRDAVGLFASDKPDADSIRDGLLPGASRLLRRARAVFRERYGTEMTAPALAGFAAAWALFHDVAPRAAALTPAGLAGAARAIRLPIGSLPNGSGLDFGSPGGPDAGSNLRAASVIWEWVSPGDREVVWPPRFAYAPLRVLPIAG